jgi:hypothetical protein
MLIPKLFDDINKKILARADKTNKIAVAITSTIIRVFVTVSSFLFLTLSLMLFKPFLLWFVPQRDAIFLKPDLTSRFLYWLTGFIPIWLFIIVLAVTIWLVWKSWSYRIKVPEVSKTEAEKKK